MTFKPARLLLALIAIAASFAYSPSFAQNLAVVNGKAIPSSRADQAVKQVVAQGQGADSPQRRRQAAADRP
jgi:peptidyl-prolyl cis-trans isomerase C